MAGASSAPAMAAVTTAIIEQGRVASLYVNDFNARAIASYRRVGYGVDGELASGPLLNRVLFPYSGHQRSTSQSCPASAAPQGVRRDACSGRRRRPRPSSRPRSSCRLSAPLLWAITLGAVLVLVAVDLALTRRPHEVSMKEALGWSTFYIALPLAFGAWVGRLRPPAGA